MTKEQQLQNMRATFGERLQLLLDANQMNMSTFSTRTGISRSAVSRYLQALRLPEGEALWKTATFFNVSVDWLLGLGPKGGSRLNLSEAFAEIYREATDSDRKILELLISKYEKTEN